ncbi:hypothetical protein ACMGE6_04465 [Macrococcus equi]|uniref:hypothetical protein n=1 Tax=Macrococcus equi TaxID=3395462 RepID=UPI0039BE5192
MFEDERIKYKDGMTFTRAFGILMLLLIGLVVSSYFFNFTYDQIRNALIVFILLMTFYVLIDSFFSKTLYTDVEKKSDIKQKVFKSFLPWLVGFNLLLVILSYTHRIEPELGFRFLIIIVFMNLFLFGGYMLVMSLWLKWYNRGVEYDEE